jgi:hypothetical protein
MSGLVQCDCGAEFELDSPEEDAHYVWSARRSGARSNLGHCPVTNGFATAVFRARAGLSGVALYHGRVV